MIEEEWWRTLLDDCPTSDDGYTKSAHIASNNDGFVTEDTDNEHHMFRLANKQFTDAKFKLYGLISDIHRGVSCAQAVRDKLLYYMLLEQGVENALREVEKTHSMSSSDIFCKSIRSLMVQVFESIEREYFNSIGDDFAAFYRQKEVALTEMTLESQQLLERTREKVSGAASTAIALIVEGRLFVISCGTVRALLLSQNDCEGTTKVEYLNQQHDVLNPSERERLLGLGLSAEQISLINTPTRCFGNFFLKGGYLDNSNLCPEVEPCSVEPTICGGFKIGLHHKFLILASPSVFKTIQQIGISSAEAGNYLMRKIAAVIAQESCDISQLVLDDICNDHCLYQVHSAVQPVTRRESMALLCVKLNEGFRSEMVQASTSKVLEIVDASQADTSNSTKKPNAHLIPSYVDFTTFDSHCMRDAVQAKVDRIFQQIKAKSKLNRIEEDEHSYC
ncbi:hypothetical protein QR680_001703 [Steinernema hermaphroditum]|uniref:PPM-type phosphatase domain-containing protein n=1 Tax=Steinernema hermaphroditum TaxID=289476 RepID=A0AA39LG32_9BILA|nr:hypothetical protein QR680_001703 [Steinernema hermaphroditum]